MVSFVGCSSSTNNETNENKEKIETKSKKVNKYKLYKNIILLLRSEGPPSLTGGVPHSFGVPAGAGTYIYIINIIYI